ncbi:class I SAM-dependent methyltransferase [Paraburkholderia sp. RL18-103-BIB-C]|uniref:class I SAM-dependent methyltransferase n=1 Tax=Paraburkholderia sp. RL18-103-BIB-C TaxID=3031637 RepID=UPI0038B8D262
MKTMIRSMFKGAGRYPWYNSFFGVPLIDLGVGGTPALRGIFTPEPEIGAEKIGISDQFLANAEDYHQRYSGSEHMKDVLEQAFTHAGVSMASSPDVLDIGTGSGTNSLLPMLSLFDHARFVATDLSPDLLVILRRYVERESLSDRVACVCTDAMNSFFAPARFDMVTGVSLLHHLIDPAAAIKAAHAALKKGGVAVFCDPFEGYGMIGLTFRLILDRATREGLDLNPEAADFMRAMIIDFDARRGTDKSDVRFRYMDDKWLFTREYLEDVACDAGFASVSILPHANNETYFRDYTTVLFRLGRDLKPDALPDWAWDTIDLIDRSFSPEMKSALLMEGSIILKK